jgi:uncharacterized protein DUF5047
VWPTSEAFQEALNSNSRRWTSKIEILYDGAVSTINTVLEGGYVGIDDVAVRREAHITFVDADGVLTPASARDLLAPTGAEMRIYRGLYLADDTIEYVPMGVFGIVKPEVRSHSDGVVVEVKGFDRVDAIRARQFTDPWTVAAGTLVTTAITDIVQSRLAVATRITASTLTTPEVVFDRLSNPWYAVEALAEAAGMKAYFDALGSLVIAPAQDEETGIVYTIGTEVATLMNVTRSMDSSETNNGVIVRGYHPDWVPVRVEIWDEDPTSPTYYLGPFGKRPFGYYSELITTEAQAQQVADALYPRVTKIQQELEITTVGTIAHDVGDTFTVIDPRSKTSGRYTVVSGTIPLRANQSDLIRLRCREAL